jgi:glutamyl-tRNA synthetase
MLWGKIKMHEFGKFSTSELRKAIERGEYEGWDDPRLPTLRALRRRGFLPEAIRKFFISMGITRNDVAVSMKNLYAENRKMVDAEANRYFFVRNPVEMRLKSVNHLVAKALKHPSREEYREIEPGDTVYLSDADFVKLKVGHKIRLKYFCTVEIESTEPLVARVVDRATKPTTANIQVIQWAPKTWVKESPLDKKGKIVIKTRMPGLKVKVKRPEGIEEGIGEPLIATELGNVVQFERYGFVRIDSVVEKETGTEVVAYFTH